MSSLSNISGVTKPGKVNAALRLGMSSRALMLGSRFLGLPGLALTAGMWGYDKWKKSKDKDEEFQIRRYQDDDED